MNNLEQKFRLRVKKFEILDNGVKTSERFLTNFFEITIPFDEISDKEVVSVSAKSGWLVAALSFLLFAVLGFFAVPNENKGVVIFWLLTAVVCFLIFFINQKKLRIIQGLNRDGLVFFDNKPNKKILDDFIKNILESRKQFFLKKYVNETFSPDERLKVLNWLYDKGIISIKEFSEQKEKIANSSVVGF